MEKATLGRYYEGNGYYKGENIFCKAGKKRAKRKLIFEIKMNIYLLCCWVLKLDTSMGSVSAKDFLK